MLKWNRCFYVYVFNSSSILIHRLIRYFNSSINLLTIYNHISHLLKHKKLLKEKKKFKFYLKIIEQHYTIPARYCRG
jgi:hypothetical protein